MRDSVAMTKCSPVLLCLSTLLRCGNDSDGVSNPHSEAGCDVTSVCCLTRDFEFGAVLIRDKATDTFRLPTFRAFVIRIHAGRRVLLKAKILFMKWNSTHESEM
jgi:hypothetical protein